ncbi:hypothetical protein DPMN_028497 [Dreissena polymorpha]|uniref:Uncharacterized protein n=1 Tax=Dreissena polymorpha TaxID=45954 RepID=A0A9D4LXD1_DREPO|nr:hypothetical protein DPMN_028497 [Dreissena polymorpha]
MNRKHNKSTALREEGCGGVGVVVIWEEGTGDGLGGFHQIVDTFAHLRGFHDDWANIATSRVHVIQLTGTIFELNSDIKETNVLTKLHEKWANNVTSRVFTCFHYIHTCIEKNAPPTGGHVFPPIRTIF